MFLNMEFLKIFQLDVAFDGWAVALISLLIASIGSGVYYSVKKVYQKQKAKNNAIQEQVIQKESLKNTSFVSQEQRANNNATQKQSL